MGLCLQSLLHSCHHYHCFWLETKGKTACNAVGIVRISLQEKTQRVLTMFKKFLAITLAVFIAGLAGYQWALKNNTQPTIQSNQNALSRIVQTKTIRCGYITYPPYLIKDPNSGEFSGVAYDFMTAIANEMDVKLQWVEEVGWGTFQEGLKGNRYDVMCVPVWQSGQRAQVALLTKPLYYNGLYAATRADDNRFDKGYDSINQPDVRVSVVDGDVTQAVKKLLFPKAKELATTQLSDKAQEVLSVSTKKADVVFVNIDQLNRYNASASAKLKLALNGKPVRYFANSLAVKHGEHDLKAALDSTIEAISNSGQASQIIAKYDSILQKNTE